MCHVLRRPLDVLAADQNLTWVAPDRILDPNLDIDKRVIDDMGVPEITIAYGMTECSPGATQTRPDDTLERLQVRGAWHFPDALPHGRGDVQRPG